MNNDSTDSSDDIVLSSVVSVYIPDGILFSLANKSVDSEAFSDFLAYFNWSAPYPAHLIGFMVFAPRCSTPVQVVEVQHSTPAPPPSNIRVLDEHDDDDNHMDVFDDYGDYPPINDPLPDDGFNLPSPPPSPPLVVIFDTDPDSDDDDVIRID